MLLRLCNGQGRSSKCQRVDRLYPDGGLVACLSRKKFEVAGCWFQIRMQEIPAVTMPVSMHHPIVSHYAVFFAFDMNNQVVLQLCPWLMRQFQNHQRLWRYGFQISLWCSLNRKQSMRGKPMNIGMPVDKSKMQSFPWTMVAGEQKGCVCIICVTFVCKLPILTCVQRLQDFSLFIESNCFLVFFNHAPLRITYPWIYQEYNFRDNYISSSRAYIIIDDDESCRTSHRTTIPVYLSA